MRVQDFASRIGRQIFVFLAVSFCFAFDSYSQQESAGHIHDLHPTSRHNGYVRTSLNGPGHSDPLVKLDHSSFETIFSEMMVNNSCNDSVERGNTYQREVTHSVRVDLTGSYEWGAEAGAKLLAAEIKTHAKAKVQLNVGWTGTWKESLNFSSKINLYKCQKMFYYFGKQKFVASGKIKTWEHEVVCSCDLHDNCSAKKKSYCVLRTITGVGTGWGQHYGEHVQRGLVDPCPCTEIDEDTRPVLEPETPGIVVVEPSESNQGSGEGESVLEREPNG